MMEIFEGSGLKSLREDFYKLARKEPAFPIVAPVSHDLLELLIAGGLKKRELFAAMALSAVCASRPGAPLLNFRDNADAIAKTCVALSDALIKALEEPAHD